MHHRHNIQLIKSINMRIAEVAPKHKNFSRTRSLDYRISHVICAHNLGYLTFFCRVLKLLGITPTTILVDWLKRKDNRCEKKKVYDNNPKNKRKRAHKQEAQTKHEIYLDRIKTIKDGTYASGVSCKPKKKAPKEKTGRKRKLCTCGQGRPHSSSNYSECARNKKKLQKLCDETDDKNPTDIVSSSHTNSRLDTTKLT